MSKTRVVFSLASFVGRCHYDQDGNPAEQVVYYLEATTPYGHVFCHHEIFESYEQEKALDFLATYKSFGDGSVDALDARCWKQRSFHVYGSEAYQNEGGEQELAKFCVESFDGIGSYTPEHPEYIG
jgi:hypothetical protein